MGPAIKTIQINTIQRSEGRSTQGDEPVFAPETAEEFCSDLALPTLSIVVPNYQGGATIGATLQSLVDQHYPHLEIIVVDGGSTDNSLEVIRRFEPYIRWWVSEPDRGQSQAINKGFAQCRGEIVNWLCSDDLLAPGALLAVGQTFATSPELDVLVGRSRVEYLTTDNPLQPLPVASRWAGWLRGLLPLGSMVPDPENPQAHLRVPTLEQINLMPAIYPIHQPSCFYRRRLLDRPQPVDESYDYTMDIELFNYFRSKNVCWQVVDTVLSIAPVSGHNKSSVAGWKAIDELERIYLAYTQEWIPLTYWHRRLRYPLERFLKQNRQRLWLYLIGPLWLLVTLVLAPFYGFKRVFALRWTGWI